MTRHRFIRRPLAVGWGAVLTILVVCASEAAGQGQSPAAAEASEPHVRALDARAAATLREGLARSATLRELVGVLETSDLVVYIKTDQIIWPGRLTFMTATSGRRVVRISLNFRNLDPSMIGWLGHELKHAVEIAGAPDVRTRESLERLYQRIGEKSTSGDWCTPAAQRARKAVLDELLAHASAGR